MNNENNENIKSGETKMDSSGGEHQCCGGGCHESDVESSSGSVETTEDQISKLKQELQDAKSAMLYQAAEVENFKKRMQREREEFARYSNESIIRDLLDAMDGIHIAISSMPVTDQTKSYLDGIKMIEQMLVKALEKHGVEKIKAEGKFDMNFHEAVKKNKKDGFETNTIIQVDRDGYLLHGRLIRPSRVVVAE